MKVVKFWGCSSSVGAWHRRDKVGRAHRKFWGCSSVGRASALQAEGRQFESDQLHHTSRLRRYGWQATNSGLPKFSAAAESRQRWRRA